MNAITHLFERKRNILSVYFTAGFPQLQDTGIVLKSLQDSGVDLIEIGMPFSDPLADGPTIQRSSEQALKNGMSIPVLFEQLEKFKNERPDVPLILMGYLNPVLQYGVEAFCKKAASLGISGLIIPDLPMADYLANYKSIFEAYNLINIFLITPQTSEERIRFIDANSNGFIYVVSSSSTTGSTTEIANEQVQYFKRIQAMQLKNPLLIGFGISNAATFTKACAYANGAIIGSAFIKAIEKSQNLKEDIATFVSSIKQLETA